MSSAANQAAVLFARARTPDVLRCPFETDLTRVLVGLPSEPARSDFI